MELFCKVCWLESLFSKIYTRYKISFDYKTKDGAKKNFLLRLFCLFTFQDKCSDLFHKHFRCFRSNCHNVQTFGKIYNICAFASFY